MCGETQVQLHHLTYERIGDERLTDLRPLCIRCHALVHVLERRGEIRIDLDGLFSEHRAAGYRAELERIAAHRAAENQQVDDADAAYVAALPLSELLAEARRRGVDISSELRVITQRLERMKHKLDAAKTRSRIAI